MEIYGAEISKNAHLKDGLYERIQGGLPEGWEITETYAWLQMQPPGIQLAEQGWKGHVSAVWYEAERIAKQVMPVLAGQNCIFKIVKNKSILRMINDCHYPMSGANKFITFYPETEEKFVRVMEELYRELTKFQGPRIYTDMQCPECSCLHYRYGAFVEMVKYDKEDEKRKYYMLDHEGKQVEDARKPWYQEPEWVINPFRSRGDKRFLAVSPKIQGTPLENYHMEKILGQANKGNVYDAVRVKDGRRVIVKEARPFIVYSESMTAFSVLENEYKMLVFLKDTGLVPKPLELFECNGNLYLVEEKAEGDSLRKYLADAQVYERDLAITCKLLSAVEQLVQMNIAWNDLTPNNIMITKDMDVRLIDFENACSYAECNSGMFATKGFYNSDAASERAPWSRDLFGLAVSILGIWLGTCVPFCSDVGEGEDRRSAINKVMEQVCLAGENRMIPVKVRNTVYSLLMQSEQKKLEGLQIRMETEEFPFPAGNRWKINYNGLEQVCLSFLQGLYQEATSNLEHAGARLWASTEFGRTTSPLNIQHGVAGIAGFLLEIAETEPYRDIVEKILQVVEDYLETMDVFQIQEDNSLLFGNHGVAWFLYDFYCQRKKPEKARRAIAFARELSCETEEQDYALGLAGYGCTYLKFWQETGDTVFLQKAVGIAEQIYTGMTGQGRATESSKALKPVKHIGFAHGEAGLLYFLYVTGETASVRKFRDCVMGHIPLYLKEVGEIVRRRYFGRETPDLSWCKGLAGIGTLLVYLAGREDEDGRIRQTVFEVSRIVTELMWRQSNCRCHGNAGSVEFLMDMHDLEPDDCYGEQARAVAKYLYTQRFYDIQGNVRFTDESRLNSYYDYGTGAAGTMRAILRARGIVRGHLYMVNGQKRQDSGEAKDE